MFRKKAAIIGSSAVVSLALFAPSVATADTANHTMYYSLLFSQDSLPSNLTQQLSSMGATLVDSAPAFGFAEIKADASDLSKLQSLGGVVDVNPAMHWSLPDSKVVPLTDTTASPSLTSGTSLTASADLYNKYQWDIKELTHNGASYSLGTGSHNTVVGIIDTGIDATHPAVSMNLMPGSMNFVPAGGFRGTEPYETGDPNNVNDIHGHGTHVAGSIAGHGRILGVAPDIGFRSYRVFGKSSAETSWIVQAIKKATDDGVDVISMSIGGYDMIGQAFQVDPVTGQKTRLGNDIADLQAFKRAVQYATEHGVVVVAAAGNEGLNLTNKSQVNTYLNEEYASDGLYFVGAGFESPGALPGVITVSATGPDDSLSSYSNWGQGSIDVAAPGGDFQRYPNGDWYTDMCLSSYKGGGYVWMAGTSMATPKVSAEAALIIDKYGKMNPSQVANMIYNKGVDAVTGTDKAYFGSGHLDVYNALQ